MTPSLATQARPAPTGSGQMAGLTSAALVLFALALFWSAVDSRTLAGGDPLWLKPAKFAFSLMVTFATLGLVQQRLSRPWAESRTLRASAAIMGAAFVFEMGYIYWQAAQGEESHFNTATAFHSLMYSLMGAGAVLVLLGVGVYGLVVLTDREARLSPALRWGVGLGFLTSVCLTLPVAGYMSMGEGHLVGVAPPGSASLPLLGWSGVVGDLRPSHFLALHAMQAIPLYVLWRERSGRIATSWEAPIAALVWSTLTLALFAQALAGLPLVPL